VQRLLEKEKRGAPPPAGLAAAGGAEGRWQFVDLPLNETIHRCFAHGLGAAAERLRSDFKVPDKRYARLKVRGLAHAHAWAALHEFGGGDKKKPPAPLELFVDACLEQGERNEAARYARRLPPAEAVPLLLDPIGRLDVARDVAMAHKEKQPELLRLVSTHGAGSTD
jgi:hypothetical protein